MGRGRLPMELIQKEKARRTTYQKRKNGLMKKVYEFSTLCGVDVCVIIYAPNFEGQGLAEPETWPQDTREVLRIIKKYHDSTSDRRPKIYGVQEYYQDRMKKVEAEISKMRKDKLKIMYPTWDDSFNALGEGQLRMFVRMLDARLDACSQRMNMLRGDLKGKATAESDQVMTLVPYLASDSSGYHNLMQNMSQAQFFPPPLNMNSISDDNQLAFAPFQLGESSQPSMFHFGQNYMQLMGKNEMVDWANQVGTVTYDPKTGMLKKDGGEDNQNFSPYYYNENIQTMLGMQTLPSQNSQCKAACPTPPDLPPGFQFNGFTDPNVVQAPIFNYMPGKK